MDASKNAKWTLAGIGLFAGLFGGFIGARLFPAAPSVADFHQIKAGHIVARSVQVVDEDNGTSCNIAGGDMALSGRLRVGNGLRVQGTDDKVLCDISGGHMAVPGCVRGNIVLGNRIFASTNPISASLNKQEILAEMSALPEQGGVMIVRNPKGVFIPEQGKVSSGQAIMVGYNVSQKPCVAVNDIDKNRHYRFLASPASGPSTGVASWWKTADTRPVSEMEDRPVTPPAGPVADPSHSSVLYPGIGQPAEPMTLTPPAARLPVGATPGAPYALPYQPGPAVESSPTIPEPVEETRPVTPTEPPRYQNTINFAPATGD